MINFAVRFATLAMYLTALVAAPVVPAVAAGGGGGGPREDIMEPVTVRVMKTPQDKNAELWF